MMVGGNDAYISALAYVDCLNANSYLGYADWRLPNVNELESLINLEEADVAAWLGGQGFTNVDVIAYWSSTFTAQMDRVWVVYFGGRSEVVSREWSDWRPVWPVRGVTTPPAQLWKTGQTTSVLPGDDGDIQAGVAWPSPRFTVGIGAEADCVTDDLTGLMWVRSSDNTPERPWQQALDYANGLSFCGFNDWRLPNKKELRSLINYGQSNVGAWLNTQGFSINVPELNNYWSSTTDALNPGAAWFFWTGLSDDSMSKPASGIDFLVWPVRGGPSVEYYQVDFEADQGVYSALLIEDSTAEVLGGFDTGELCFGGPGEDYYEGGPSDQKFWLRLEDRPGGGQTMHILSRFANQPIVRVIPCDPGSPPQEGKSTLPRPWVGSGDEEPPQEWVEGGGTLGNPIQEPYEQCDLQFAGSVQVNIADYKGTYRTFRNEVRDPLRNSPLWFAEDVEVDWFRRSGAGYAAELRVDTRLCRQAVADTIQLVPEETVEDERRLYLIDYD